MVAVFVVQPDGVVLRADGGDERSAVGRHGNSFLRCWAKGDLLGLSIREALAPDVEVVSFGGQIDPFAVGRPRAGTTLSGGRADGSDVVLVLKGDDAAVDDETFIVHL